MVQFRALFFVYCGANIDLFRHGISTYLRCLTVPYRVAYDHRVVSAHIRQLTRDGGMGGGVVLLPGCPAVGVIGKVCGGVSGTFYAIKKA